MTPEVGKTYKVNHCRKGQFTIKVTSVNDEWFTGIITDGKADALLDYNVKEVGQEITTRISFCKFALVKDRE